MKRIGLGKGKGKGYKNIIPKDKKVHHDSGRGIKQPQAIRFIRALPLNSNRLPVQFSIIVPATELDKNIPEKEFEKRIEDEKEYFSKLFGGDTSIKAVGSYWDGKKLIKEKAVLVTSSMSVDIYNKERKELAKHIKEKQKDWKQDTILHKIEGQDFITPKKSYIINDKKQSDFILVS
jgi:hypothetical protein